MADKPVAKTKREILIEERDALLEKVAELDKEIENLPQDDTSDNGSFQRKVDRYRPPRTR